MSPASREEEKKSSKSKSDKKNRGTSDSKDAGTPKEFAQWELAPDEFIVTVTLDGKSILGLDVDWADGRTLYVKGVKEGVVKQWNLSNPNDSVNAGDRVIAVNGVADDPQAMLGVVKKRGKLSLLLRGQVDRRLQKEKERLKQLKEAATAGAAAPLAAASPGAPTAGVNEIVLSLDAVGQSLGLDVDWADGKVLYVRGVQSGAIEDWNRRNASDKWIQPGDSIVAVNGVSADPEAMAQQCRSSKKLQMRIIGAPLPPPEEADERDKKKRKKDKDKER